MRTCILVASLICAFGYALADITGTDPPNTSCLCLTSSSVAIRDQGKLLCVGILIGCLTKVRSLISLYNVGAREEGKTRDAAALSFITFHILHLW